MKSSTSANVRSLVTDKLSSIFFEVAAGRADAAMTDTITVASSSPAKGSCGLREVTTSLCCRAARRGQWLRASTSSSSF